MTTHDTEENIVCFSFVVDFHDNNDPDAWERILDGFLVAVEAEGASAGGGMHPLGTNKYCDDCRFKIEEEKEPWWKKILHNRFTYALANLFRII